MISTKNLILLFFACLLYFFTNQNLIAQSTISGTLIEAETKVALFGGHVKLSSSDSSFYFGVSDYDGKFAIEVSKNGSYTIEVSYIGYELLKKTLSVNGNISLESISLKMGSALLEAIEVKARQVRVVQKGDTTQYNADAYGTNPNAAAEELLQKMPGFAEVDGKMQVQGENITKVLVNGKPFFGEDSEMALKNLPAEVID